MGIIISISRLASVLSALTIGIIISISQLASLFGVLTMGIIISISRLGSVLIVLTQFFRILHSSHLSRNCIFTVFSWFFSQLHIYRIQLISLASALLWLSQCLLYCIKLAVVTILEVRQCHFLLLCIIIDQWQIIHPSQYVLNGSQLHSLSSLNNCIRTLVSVFIIPPSAVITHTPSHNYHIFRPNYTAFSSHLAHTLA
jgi:hypothetical protein